MRSTRIGFNPMRSKPESAVLGALTEDRNSSKELKP
jgi:hypothetical protein